MPIGTLDCQLQLEALGSYLDGAAVCKAQPVKKGPQCKAESELRCKAKKASRQPVKTEPQCKAESELRCNAKMLWLPGRMAPRYPHFWPLRRRMACLLPGLTLS